MLTAAPIVNYKILISFSDHLQDANKRIDKIEKRLNKAFKLITKPVLLDLNERLNALRQMGEKTIASYRQKIPVAVSCPGSAEEIEEKVNDCIYDLEDVLTDSMTSAERIKKYNEKMKRIKAEADETYEKIHIRVNPLKLESADRDFREFEEFFRKCNKEQLTKKLEKTLRKHWEAEQLNDKQLEDQVSVTEIDTLSVCTLFRT